MSSTAARALPRALRSCTPAPAPAPVGHRHHRDTDAVVATVAATRPRSSSRHIPHYPQGHFALRSSLILLRSKASSSTRWLLRISISTSAHSTSTARRGPSSTQRVAVGWQSRIAMQRRNAEPQRPFSEFYAHQRSAESATGTSDERRMLLDDDSLNEPSEKTISWFVGSSSHPIAAGSSEGEREAVPTPPPPASHFVRDSEHMPAVSSSVHRAPVAQQILHAQQQQQQQQQ